MHNSTFHSSTKWEALCWTISPISRARCDRLRSSIETLRFMLNTSIECAITSHWAISHRFRGLASRNPERGELTSTSMGRDQLPAPISDIRQDKYERPPDFSDWMLVVEVSMLLIICRIIRYFGVLPDLRDWAIGPPVLASPLVLIITSPVFLLQLNPDSHSPRT